MGRAPDNGHQVGDVERETHQDCQVASLTKRPGDCGVYFVQVNVHEGVTNGSPLGGSLLSAGKLLLVGVRGGGAVKSWDRGTGW